MRTPRPSVLLVDDDAPLREMLRTYLRRRGVDVIDVASARGALDVLEHRSVDIVVSDIHMPGHSGLWLLRQVRARWDDLPVILITGRPPGEPTGADVLLVKPFPGNDLDAHIRALTSV